MISEVSAHTLQHISRKHYGTSLVKRDHVNHPSGMTEVAAYYKELYEEEKRRREVLEVHIRAAV